MVTVDELLLQGGDLALDFVNTVGGMRQDPPDPEYEALNSYANVVEWSLRLALVSPRDARALLRQASEQPREAEREALAHAALVPDGGRMRWTWEGTAPDLRAPLWPLAHAAVELLTHGPLERLKVCANCRWLFLDQSRNHSRRWCSMDDCGSAVKKERYVERRRSRRGATTG